MTPPLSKSRFLSGLQCELRLWYEVHERGLATPAGAALQAVFATGHEVGALARERFPGGVLVEQDHRHGDDAVEATRALLADPSVPAIYEGGFEHEGVLVRADVLVRDDDAGWDLVEVKSTTRVKEVHDLDVAVQAWVLRGAGLDLRRSSVLTIDRDYLWPGGPYDLRALFALHDRTEVVDSLLPDIAPEVARLHQVLAAGAAPEIAPGPQCTSPYECPFLAHCTRDAAEPEWPLSVLPRLHARRREALDTAGIDDVRDIPADFDLNRLQTIVRESVLSGRDAVHGDLAAALASVERPVHHLDFEAMNPALPRVPGTRPYDQIPFQFSVDTEREDGTLVHAEYLHSEATDPRDPLARALLAALGDTGSIVVYSGFEARMIRELAAALLHLAPALDALLPRLWDLLSVVRANYYHPDFRGSFSIKSVLPTLAPDLSYDDLDIADGNLASIRYLDALRSEDAAEREAIFRALREYCGRDTLGMVEVRRVLGERVARG